MSAKRPAPKSAKGKKAASRPPVRKALARKPDPPRGRVVAAAAVHTRKSMAPAPRKATPGVPAPAEAEEAIEMRKPVRIARSEERRVGKEC